MIEMGISVQTTYKLVSKEGCPMRRISPIRPYRKDGPALKELKESLQNTQRELSLAFEAFDYASDPDLTESCIFTISALQRRMDYLIKQIKEQESAVAAVGVRRAR